MLPVSKIQQPLTLIIVDDEKDACANINDILANEAEIPLEVLGVAHNTHEAEKLINALKPDAVLLDIEMPGEDAFQFLKRLPEITFDIVFITAYDEYAVKAFQLNAVDYLLKPVDTEDLQIALGKLKERSVSKHLLKEFNLQLNNVQEQLHHKKTPDTLMLRDKDVIEIVSFNNILYIEAKGSYAKIIFKKGNAKKQIIASNPISMYTGLLPETLFYRIHKSYLVNCSFIADIIGGEKPEIVLADDIRLPVGKRRFAALKTFLKNSIVYLNNGQS